MKTVKIEKEGETTMSLVITINENISWLQIFSPIIEFRKKKKNWILDTTFVKILTIENSSKNEIDPFHF